MIEKAFTDEQSVQIICALIQSTPLAKSFPNYGAISREENMWRDVFSSEFAQQLRELHASLTAHVDVAVPSRSDDE